MALLYVIAAAFLLVLAILWFCLPFAVFGTQPKIDKLLSEMQVTNKLLAAINESLKPMRTKQP